MPATTDVSAKTSVVQAAGSNVGLAHVEEPDGSGAFVDVGRKFAVGFPAGAVTMFVAC